MYNSEYEKYKKQLLKENKENEKNQDNDTVSKDATAVTNEIDTYTSLSVGYSDDTRGIMDPDPFGYEMNIVWVGEDEVGKRTLLKHFAKEGEFISDYRAVLGIKPYSRFELVDNKKICYSIREISSEGKIKSMRSLFFKITDAAFVIFDLTNRISFNKTESWIEELRKANNELVIILVGTKNDLNNERKINKNEAEDLAKKVQAFKYVETSGNTGENLEEIFMMLSRKLIEKRES
ncbi:MAG: GTP-binding protein [Candidatus Heimdallarchaeota archaeon]|nr:GTP-binding protein [Candidatus Heimdallarchaeota archaeon]MDH5647304.1 GTP-binding protein [Candidatus Heimdallarchaeota archaeon]